MSNATVIVAFLALIGTIISSYLNLKGQKAIAEKSRSEMIEQIDRRSELTDKLLEAKIDSNQQLTDVKLRTLTDEVRKYCDMGSEMPLLKKQIDNLEKRLTNLEDR